MERADELKGRRVFFLSKIVDVVCASSLFYTLFIESMLNSRNSAVSEAELWIKKFSRAFNNSNGSKLAEISYQGMVMVREITSNDK